MRLMMPQVCRAIRTISAPRIRYHQAAVPKDKSLPKRDAAAPSAVKVTAIPTAKIREKRNAADGSFFPVPPTYATTSGTLDREHGVKLVRTPASSARTGAS